MNEYTEYSKIEKHISLSKLLYELDIKSRNIINELDSKKHIPKSNRRNSSYTFSNSTYIVYNNIINCSSLKRLKMYFCLQYFLDELMYYEVKNINKFYIEDNVYNISKIYFGQDEWIIDLYVQKFNFYSEKDVNINEAMYLICYLREYDNCLLEIEEYIKPIKTIPKIKRKIRDTIQRIRLRHNNIWIILLNIINNNIDQNDPNALNIPNYSNFLNIPNIINRQHISNSPITPSRLNHQTISIISNSSNDYYISS